MKTKIHGILAAFVTPMNAKEQIDLKVLAKHADYLIRQGTHGLIPLGSTGEYYALTAQERQDVLRATLDAAGGRVPVLAGTNGGSTREVIEYSRQAERLGCDGVLLAPPYYSRPTLDELYDHFRAVNNAIGIPIMLYNYPGRTGVDMTPEFIERLTKLPRVRYVKESTGEIVRISTLIRTCGDRLGVFCGADTGALESFVLGAIGWVGGVVNALPKSHAMLYDMAVVRRDFAAARAFYYQLLPMLNLAEGCGKYTQFVKAACGLTGHPVGPPRRPLLPATAAECAKLRSALKGLPESRGR